MYHIQQFLDRPWIADKWHDNYIWLHWSIISGGKSKIHPSSDPRHNPDHICGTWWCSVSGTWRTSTLYWPRCWEWDPDWRHHYNPSILVLSQTKRKNRTKTQVSWETTEDQDRIILSCYIVIIYCVSWTRWRNHHHPTNLVLCLTQRKITCKLGVIGETTEVWDRTILSCYIVIIYWVSLTQINWIQ